MSGYVDGFVVPVPKNKVDAYRRLARKAAKIWREHGALEYVEALADDVKRGKVTSFPLFWGGLSPTGPLLRDPFPDG